MSAIISSVLGGGAREHAPGTESWMRLESQPLHKDPFSEVTTWRRRHQGVPWFVWPMLAASVLAISSAGPAFEQITDVQPITLAAWRLQLTSVILFFGAAYQWTRELDLDQRQAVLQSWRWITGSGVCLALHFGFWVWSLEHTSLTHSLLFVCSVPVLIAIGTMALRKPISQGEVFGSLLGLAGGLLLALGPRKEDDPSKPGLAGDLAALTGAVVFIGYLMAGRELRQWMPIFVYAAPTTGLAAVLLTLSSLVFDGASLFRGGKEGAMGWLADAHYAPWVVYLSLIPGIIGHTGFNTLLRYLTPLTVSLAFQLEPLFGTLIGCAAGVVAAPGWPTWVGGITVLVATCWVTAATAKREARQEAKGVAVLELENVFASEQEGLLEVERHAHHAGSAQLWSHGSAGSGDADRGGKAGWLAHRLSGHSAQGDADDHHQHLLEAHHPSDKRMHNSSVYVLDDVDDEGGGEEGRQEHLAARAAGGGRY